MSTRRLPAFQDENDELELKCLPTLTLHENVCPEIPFFGSTAIESLSYSVLKLAFAKHK